ncbi:Similar to Kdm8: Bifunctional peptidase and arginyl-hydroxylase JMJD5 (Mus musculus) [Cotesia congregata]|uniref:Similar to Kdm8: Bifunctional peptidase and arginyl-hydroxylase JMJD5 (Mus musculus) n=1 Tax=Cotesia congregata TaxID=51543 RepID=A0A8J2GZN3_COTCN|nr:Similar to Kdm8: Bifunctional peptidase and arginyl-hydroxylase JMJD5 (Mus musculus) [Cotesia congregata]
MIILGSGGHTTEMFKVLNFLDLDKYYPRVYVHGHSDLMSELKLKSFEIDNDCKVIKIFRSREVGQSYYTSVITTLIAFINAGVIMFREKPDLILANERIDCKLIEIEACLDRTWENLNTGYWKDVSIGHRYCYTICSLLKCILLEIDSREEKNKIQEIAKQIDKGLLLGAPIVEAPELLTNIASKINNYLEETNSYKESLKFEIDDKNIPSNLLEGCEWIKKYKSPSMETFYRDIFKCKVPAVLEECISHWKALTTWKDPNYLIKIGGMRTVPIEIGSSYTQDDWSQQLVTLSEFIKSHVAKKNDTVFGHKQIILYHPEDSKYLYTYDTRLLSNTAQVNPLNPDYNKFPEFKNAKGFMCYLKPGQALYIPPKWWHHVVSLSPSFSISFWWN